MFTKTTGDFRVANMAREGPMAKNGLQGQHGPMWSMWPGRATVPPVM